MNAFFVLFLLQQIFTWGWLRYRGFFNGFNCDLSFFLRLLRE